MENDSRVHILNSERINHLARSISAENHHAPSGLRKTYETLVTRYAELRERGAGHNANAFLKREDAFSDAVNSVYADIKNEVGDLNNLTPIERRMLSTDLIGIYYLWVYGGINPIYNSYLKRA